MHISTSCQLAMGVVVYVYYENQSTKTVMGQKKSKASKVTLEQIVARCGVKEECLKKECSQEHLLKLAEYCDSLTVVGLALGLSEIQISDIDKDHRTTEEKRVALVQKWKQSSAFNATYEYFIQALLACGRAEQATEVCRMRLATNIPELEPANVLLASDDQQYAHDSHTQGGLSLTDRDPDLTSDRQRPAKEEISSPFSYVGSPNEASNISAKLNELEQDYRKIGKHFIKSLIREKVTMEDLQIYAATLPLSVQTHYEELQTSQLSMVTKDTMNVTEFVGVLNKYSNVLSPTLLADVIEEYGDEETKSLMNEYSEKLDRFQTETQVKQLVGVFHAVTPKRYAEIELELKANWEEKTLKDIAPPKRTWLLKRVIYGSLRVVFSIANIEDLEEEDVREYLQRHVKRVFVNGKCILNFESDQTTALEHDVHLSSTDAHFVSHDSNPSDSESGYSVTSDPDLISDFQAAVANTISGQIAPEESETVKVTEIPSDFRFSSTSHGKNIILSEDGLEARKIWQHGSYACVYIATPLSGTCEFEVEVTDCDSTSSIPGSLKIGVCQCTKGTYKHLDMPDLIRLKNENFCTWSHDIVCDGLSGDVIETKYGSVNLRELKTGDKLAMRLSENGDLHFFFNGVNQGLASRNMYREGWDIYPVINIYGRCKAVRIIRAEYGHLAKGYMCKGQVDESISIGNIQFGFHPITGSNVKLFEDGLYARRIDPILLNAAVVYGATPIKHHSILEVTIAEYEHIRDNNGDESSIQIGVMRRPINTELRQSDVPNSSENGEYHFVWRKDKVFSSLSTDVGSASSDYGRVNLDNLQEGDKVGLRLSSDGTLSFFVNGKNQGVAIRGLHKEGYNIYPVVDLFCNCRAVRITRAEIHSEVLGLQELCVEKIATCLDSGSSEEVNLLPLPQRQKNQIQQYIDYL